LRVNATSRASVHEPARKTSVIAETEVLVLGGGPAGIAAAASAAAAGRRAMLVERYGFLGGMGTAAGVTNFCGLHANVHGEVRRVVHGIADELLQRIAALGGLNEPHSIFGKTAAQAYDVAAYKCAADELLAARGVRLLFHAVGAGVAMRDGETLDALLVETKSGRGAIRAQVFIDASGDADLAAWAGAPWEKGDEAGNLLYPTLMFRVANVDNARAGEAWREVGERMADAAQRGWRFPRQGAILRPMKHAGEWRVNVTQIEGRPGHAMDGTNADELSAGEVQGRRQVIDFLRFLRAEMPGFEGAYLLDIAPQVGIRETRRIVGRAMLTADDVLGCASFADTIGVNGWPLERHVAGDVLWSWPPIPESRGFNQLPYRMLVPQRVRNLLVAGRCASMTSAAQSAARVSGACFAMGEAAGWGAALALSGATDPGEIDIAALQSALEGGGAYLGRDIA
jgi:hypothetical protein